MFALDGTFSPKRLDPSELLRNFIRQQLFCIRGSGGAGSSTFGMFQVENDSSEDLVESSVAEEAEIGHQKATKKIIAAKVSEQEIDSLKEKAQASSHAELSAVVLYFAKSVNMCVAKDETHEESLPLEVPGLKNASSLLCLKKLPSAFDQGVCWLVAGRVRLRERVAVRKRRRALSRVTANDHSMEPATSFAAQDGWTGFCRSVEQRLHPFGAKRSTRTTPCRARACACQW